MSEDILSFDLSIIKEDIQKAISASSKRGLLHSAKWFAELNYALKNVKLDKKRSAKIDIDEEEYDVYSVCKAYFDVQEYDRCAYFSEELKSPCGRFLNMYSKYMSIDKKQLERGEDGLNGVGGSLLSNKLVALSYQLGKERAKGNLDSYLLFIYGMVLKKLDLTDLCRTILSEAVALEPLNWAAWLQLGLVIRDRSKLKSLSLPNHWIKHFFLGHVFVELQLVDEAIKVYTELQKAGFQDSTYVLDRIGIALHNKREVENSIAIFEKIRKMDPYRLDGLDTYSNLLYVREKRVELAYLAQHAVEVDKYRVETCCLIANYYGLRGEHQKAVLYFQRALKLNPQYLSAWTLMGHEYMEMKNINGAIQSYRNAIEVYRLDYRAWYGLGQAYEILKMPLYACIYYREAQAQKPNDARMLIALGETYEKLDRIFDAIKCFYKARSVGDHENTALLKLAKLFESVNEMEEATAAYSDYVNKVETVMGSGVGALTCEASTELCLAYKYLANTHLKNNRLKEAFHYAQKCMNHEETKEEGKALLRTIAQKSGLEGPSNEDDKSMQVEESDSSMNEHSAGWETPTRKVNKSNVKRNLYLMMP